MPGYQTGHKLVHGGHQIMLLFDERPEFRRCSTVFVLGGLVRFLLDGGGGCFGADT